MSDPTDLIAAMRKVDAFHEPSEANALLAAGAKEIARLGAEGTMRMDWILGLIDHAKALGTRYAADWYKTEMGPPAGEGL